VKGFGVPRIPAAAASAVIAGACMGRVFLVTGRRMTRGCSRRAALARLVIK
jgi:hypothetical protein